jgi:hypothetical protein
MTGSELRPSPNLFGRAVQERNQTHQRRARRGTCLAGVALVARGIRTAALPQQMKGTDAGRGFERLLIVDVRNPLIGLERVMGIEPTLAAWES